jgi:propanol-preferring alcohol dehydrogenase
LRVMVLKRVGEPLVLEQRPDPEPGPSELLIRVEACGVCRTDLHVVDGELPDVRPPIVPGHEVVGRVVRSGAEVEGASRSARGSAFAWLGRACGHCPYCRDGRENLCDDPTFTGYNRDGGYATHIVAEAAFTVRLADDVDAAATAPLLCAGLIGWRALKAAGPGRRVGLYGFGAAAHILAQICRSEGREVYAFTRPGDDAAQSFARGLGAVWAGGSDKSAPAPLDAAILFAPVGALVPASRCARPEKAVASSAPAST